MRQDRPGQIFNRKAIRDSRRRSDEFWSRKARQGAQKRNCTGPRPICGVGPAERRGHTRCIGICGGGRTDFVRVLASIERRRRPSKTEFGRPVEQIRTERRDSWPRSLHRVPLSRIGFILPISGWSLGGMNFSGVVPVRIALLSFSSSLQASRRLEVINRALSRCPLELR